MRRDANTIGFDELEFMEQLGEGSFGAVHKAKWNHQIVAVKTLKDSDFSGDAAMDLVAHSAFFFKKKKKKTISHRLFAGFGSETDGSNETEQECVVDARRRRATTVQRIFFPFAQRFELMCVYVRVRSLAVVVELCSGGSLHAKLQECARAAEVRRPLATTTMTRLSIAEMRTDLSSVTNRTRR